MSSRNASDPPKRPDRPALLAVVPVRALALLALLWGLLLAAVVMLDLRWLTILVLALLFPAALLLLEVHARSRRSALERLRLALWSGGAEPGPMRAALGDPSDYPHDYRGLLGDIEAFLDRTAATEGAMRASTQATQNILNSTRNAVLGVGADGRCLFANSAAHALVGLAPGELVGKSVHEELHVRLLGEQEREAVAGGAVQCRFCAADAEPFRTFYNEELLAGDGRILDVDYESFRIGTDDEPFGSIITLTDVSERRAVERRYELLVNTVPVGIFTTDLASRIQFANARFWEILGMDEAELEDGKIPEGVFDPDEVSEAMEHVEVATAAGASFAVEHRLHRRDGEVLWVLSSGDLDRDRSGRVVGINGIWVDITELKAAQEALRVLNAGLEARVEERTEALRRSNLELGESMRRLEDTQQVLVEQEKMAALGGLVAGLAHEINTPIGVSAGAASHLSATLADWRERLDAQIGDDAELARFRDDLVEAADLVVSNLARASDLIRRFKRVSVDQTHQNERVFDLRANVEDAVGTLQRELSLKGVEVALDCPSPLPIHGDPGSFGQMHTIVINNALEHAFAAGHSARPRLDIVVRVEGGALELDYRDNGAGMTDDVRAHVFEPFFTTRRHEGGTGLGLHILYLLVTQSLGGSVRCEAGEAGGTALRIAVPLREPAALDGVDLAASAED